MAVTLPSSLVSLIPNYSDCVVNCTSPVYRELSSQIHIALIPLIKTSAILHTPYQSSSTHAFKQFKKSSKTLVVQVGGIVAKQDDVFVYPLDVPSVKPVVIEKRTITIVEPSLLSKFSFMKNINTEYLVTDFEEAFNVREKAMKDEITEVVILKATEYFDTTYFKLFFCPLHTTEIHVVTGEKIETINETMRYVMNRYSFFDRIRQANTFMLLLLDPDWYNSECFQMLRKFIQREHNVVTVFMGRPDNKLLNYEGQVDMVIALGADTTDLKMEGDIPVITPFEAIFALELSDTMEWTGEYPIGLKRTEKYIKMLSQ
ncbi:hypothetical protein EIN_408840 [Entamoeba invadens IP1]|uniref:Uncharacterized protein n=1 Tax=Entamoeba invadens IP1 TaxID=370355 RepID=A0A0A1TZJ9_ENTIV|nr:hypothetical protein EIN_408840 [Entamoeba invadens IP1]ELP85605.1 hypothetical protein EIN_408840 [Entamoeba invadens IP1]|eukprot:XP_004184951.1 hypothetical protein EIN_408840 [Entamoeba invadens IP1]